jgi:hypothetical protein
MAQVHNYPLPPLFLTEILERGVTDHTHVCDEYCNEEWMMRSCASALADNEQLLEVSTIVKIEEGHGRHVCDHPDDENGCGWRDRWDDATNREYRVRRTGYDRCMRDCDNSDWVVTVCYSRRGWWATYGINRAGDVQDVSLWAD